MTRAQPKAHEIEQTTQSYKTGPQRASFMPAQRVGQTIPPPGIFVHGREEEEEVEETEEEEEVKEPRAKRRTQPEPQPQPQQPLTKAGYPDRRFRGQRDLPPPEETRPEFRRARTGPIVGDTHLTIDGKPDRRFKENRNMTDEEVMRHWVHTLSEQYEKGGQGRSSR